MVLESKEYLKQAYWLNERIKVKQEKLAELKASSISIGAIDYSKDRVQGGSGTNSPFENQVMKIIDLEKEIEQDIQNLCLLKIEIINAIDSVPDKNYSMLLSKRYMQMKPLKQVAKEMNYSYSHTKYLHRKALQMFVVPENRMIIPNNTFVCDRMIE